jgi:hypothetical protein
MDGGLFTFGYTETSVQPELGLDSKLLHGFDRGSRCGSGATDGRGVGKNGYSTKISHPACAPSAKVRIGTGKGAINQITSKNSPAV